MKPVLAEEAKYLSDDDDFQGLLEQSSTMNQTPYSTPYCQYLGEAKRPDVGKCLDTGDLTLI